MNSTVLRSLCVFPSLFCDILVNEVLKSTSTSQPTPSTNERKFSDPEPCTGLCKGEVHDPSVAIAEDGTYFRFTTMSGLNIATAPKMDGPWTHQGAVLADGSSIDLDGNMDLWAPDVFNKDGTYYLYYSVSTLGSQDSDIGVATSDSLEPGSWKDHGSIGILADPKYNRIDPNLFLYTEDSPYYLSFGSYWDNIFQVEMNDPPLKVAGHPKHLEQNTTSRPDDLPDSPVEGSYQFWWTVDDTDYFYLFFSSGTCCNEPPDLVPKGEEYKIMVCRSTSATGGFKDKDGKDCLTENGGTLVLGSHDDVYAPGGQGILYDPTLESVLVYYHYIKPSVGYEQDQFFFGYNKLNLDSGWPEVVS